MSYHSDKINVYRGLFTALPYHVVIKRLSRVIQVISYNLYGVIKKGSPTPSLILVYMQMGVPKPRLLFLCSPIPAHFSSEFGNKSKKSRVINWGKRGLGG